MGVSPVELKAGRGARRHCLSADIDRAQLDERMADLRAAKTHWQGEVYGKNGA